MKVHHFFNSTPIEIGTVEIENSELVHQIKRVLRLKPGEPLALLDGSGSIGMGTITGIGDVVLVDIQDIEQKETVDTLKKTLYVAVVKKDKFEWIAEKATEIGIQKIVPIITSRTIKTNLNLDRIRKIIQEAVEQSGRGIIPELTEIMTLTDALDDAKEHTHVFLAHQNGIQNTDTVFTAGFVGPEGGWTDEELKLFQEHSIQNIKLAPFVLRTETAAILASSFMVQ